jgi:Flp pilus assembly protein TadG
MIKKKPGIFNMISTVTIVLRKLVERREGAVAIIFGLCAIPAVIAAGMAIDVGRAYMVKIRLGAALDAAALAVGSETNQTSTQLTSDLQNYFTANYPSSALGTNVTVAPVPANADLTSSTLTFQAQATVPMTFMQLVGVNSINVTVTAQTKKTSGLEVAVVLDNTGSMLCGPNDGAPNYSDAQCGGSVVASDTTCTDASNQSRICTLIKAATQFVNTLTSAITASQQLYISIVPYVTTVNVGSSFCTGATSCSHITTDSCSGDFTDDKGNPIYNPTAPTSITTVTGTTNKTTNPTTITSISNISVVSPYMSITGSGVPSNTYVTAVNTAANSITISASATSSNTNTTLTLGPGGKTTSGSPTVQIGSPLAITAGMVITGTGIPPYDAVQTPGTTSVTMCHNATATSSWTPLTLYNPITYDTTNTNTTRNWMGCVIEPTSHDENSSVSGVIDSTTADPDYTEPSSWPNWYPFWWASDSGNNWATNGIKAQSAATETQGNVVSDWLTLYGPNEGCPVPLLPLTDVTSAAGKTQVLNTISSMWPRDAGGTQVHIGMIWGWRVLSPNGPFTANNGHPLSYSNASTTGWKKVIVLMTDGTEEWPATDNMTGLGQIADGKIGTTSNTATAVSNLNTRLADVCSNLASNGNYVVYTIGLGSDGASNTELQNCPTNGGFFSAATTSNLQSVFNNIAKALIALRLTQ